MYHDVPCDKRLYTYLWKVSIFWVELSSGCEIRLLLDDMFGDNKQVPLLGMIMVQERGIPMNQPVFHGIREGF